MKITIELDEKYYQKLKHYEKLHGETDGEPNVTIELIAAVMVERAIEDGDYFERLEL